MSDNSPNKECSMAPTQSGEKGATIEELQFQVTKSRSELKNLRQQLVALTHQYRKDVDRIKSMLVNPDLLATPTAPAASQATPTISPTPPATDDTSDTVQFHPIGVIRTIFPEKRAVPRQSGIATYIPSYIEIKSSCFNNPSHSLDRLDEFSHLWVIYHFHKNERHSKAKVSPPRLNGERVGVFSTRSPHRPCPIGLSLVRIDRIEEERIYFYGTDMMDGTPVLDVKPYIPQYDCPDAIFPSLLMANLNLSREPPDGQENDAEDSNPRPSSSQDMKMPMGNEVRIPEWVKVGPMLTVLFDAEAEAMIEALKLDKRAIEEMVQCDPRSVYLKNQYNYEMYTFQAFNVEITCKFDDGNGSVTVVQINQLDSGATQESQ